MRVDLESQLGDRLPSDVETALFRIVQEALTNIVKHAGELGQHRPRTHEPYGLGHRRG